MEEAVDLLVRELSGLCKGRGLQEVQTLRRLGPNLREVFGIRHSDHAAEQRRQLQVGLFAASRELPPDLRSVLVDALGFDRGGPRFLKDRLLLAAEKIDRDPRTARRRLRQALQTVAERLAPRLQQAGSNNPYAPSGWRVESLRSLLRMDLPSPRLTESREIIATEENLSRITASISLPQPPDRREPPTVDVVAEQGCTVASSTQVSTSHWLYELNLPEPLHIDQRHRYAVSFIASTLAAIRPYYVLVPFRPCRYFSADVHFGSPPVARCVWRIDGVPPAVLDDAQPVDPRYDPAVLPVVGVEFADVLPGLCYGLQWTWSTDPRTSHSTPDLVGD